MAKLTEDFFRQDTRTAARALLGKYLVRETDGQRMALRLTETEAYMGRLDKASHAYGYKRTKRTETLFAPPGTVYIYLIYGMYHCLNFVTETEGEPCAVLIRAGEAVLGENWMAQARFGKDPNELSPYQRKNFLNGPGKVCRALSLTREQNGISLFGDSLWVCDDPADLGLAPTSADAPRLIHTGPRIGIDYAQEAVHFPWRFRI